ncbi:MAG: GAF domain-containing protein, partial [Chloroflexota bacterium]|nr:GAF domain-containing protein [Chloroflexota bacterium]
MDRPDERDKRIRDLEERLSRLSEAGLRITEDLDFSTVLQGVLDSARSLTGARYGVIALHGDDGITGDFLSSGMTADEAERLWTIQGWPSHFQYLSRLPGPLRIPDLLGHIKSLGLPDLVPPVAVSERVSFLASPVLHRGKRVGSIYLAEKEHGQEFTREDEETLVLFASQAAMAIANARRHAEEQRARADLETLIDTSPVGVVVFDAVTGAPKSFNREARRIVDSLRNPDQSPEDLLPIVTLRRADGRVVSLREFPMAELLSVNEIVRAEEIVLAVPDGRSVTTLLNATPILADGGAVESVVVTLQDMADVEELQRLRAEFLAMVSHELRTPLTSIKGSAAAIMDAGMDIDPAVVRQFVRIIGDQADHMNALVADLLDVARIETATLPVMPEPAEVAVLVGRARNTFRSAGGRNNLAIDIEPDLPLVMADRRRIVQVLGNLLSNAARHSPETSVIR